MRRGRKTYVHPNVVIRLPAMANCLCLCVSRLICRRGASPVTMICTLLHKPFVVPSCAMDRGKRGHPRSLSREGTADLRIFLFSRARFRAQIQSRQGRSDDLHRESRRTDRVRAENFEPEDYRPRHTLATPQYSRDPENDETLVVAQTADPSSGVGEVGGSPELLDIGDNLRSPKTRSVSQSWETLNPHDHPRTRIHRNIVGEMVRDDYPAIARPREFTTTRRYRDDYPVRHSEDDYIEYEYERRRYNDRDTRGQMLPMDEGYYDYEVSAPSRHFLTFRPAACAQACQSHGPGI